MTSEFWRDRRVLFVTGHTGFKGSWLCLLLHSLGARVTAIPSRHPRIRASTRRRALANLSNPRRATFAISVAHQGDVLRGAGGGPSPGAQSIVLHSHDDPVETYPRT
jgi:CDP-glucose 4,6-dehydratase